MTVKFQRLLNSLTWDDDYYFLSLFILDRERDSMSEGGADRERERERERDDPKQAPLAVQSLMQGS